MKLAPLSSDLMLKLALGAGVLFVLVYYAKQAADAVAHAGQGAARTAGQVADAVISAPSAAVNAGVSVIAGRDETLGGMVYTATHADPVTSAPAVLTPATALPATAAAAGARDYWTWLTSPANVTPATPRTLVDPQPTYDALGNPTGGYVI